MSIYIIQEQTLTSIANAIRSKTGSDDAITPIQMVTAIGGISGEDSSLVDSIIDRSITEIENDRVTTIGNNAFYECSNLTTVSFPNCSIISNNAFYQCFNLKSLYLTRSSVCRLLSSNAFSLTPIGGYYTSADTYGSIYVPAGLLTTYQSATNWAYFSSRFVSLNIDIPVIDTPVIENTFTLGIPNDGLSMECIMIIGMTWGEWLGSDLNILGGDYTSNNLGYQFNIIDANTGTPVELTTVIDEGGMYVVM